MAVIYWPTSDPWGALGTALNSSFTTSLIGALAGAYPGARAAQRIAEREKAREVLAKEIRQLNTAAVLLYGIANTGIGLKKQHVKRMHDEYQEQRRQLECS